MMRRNFSVTLMRPVLYAMSIPAKVATVARTAWTTMPG